MQWDSQITKEQALRGIPIQREVYNKLNEGIISKIDEIPQETIDSIRIFVPSRFGKVNIGG